jgi:hypothetical protein
VAQRIASTCAVVSDHAANPRQEQERTFGGTTACQGVRGCADVGRGGRDLRRAPYRPREWDTGAGAIGLRSRSYARAGRPARRAGSHVRGSGDEVIPVVIRIGSSHTMTLTYVDQMGRIDRAEQAPGHDSRSNA